MGKLTEVQQVVRDAHQQARAEFASLRAAMMARAIAAANLRALQENTNGK